MPFLTELRRAMRVGYKYNAPHGANIPISTEPNIYRKIKPPEILCQAAKFRVLSKTARRKSCGLFYPSKLKNFQFSGVAAEKRITDY
jgi:hypothetical protein